MERSIYLEQDSALSTEYKERLDAIISIELTPENIDSYATSALNGIIDVASDLKSISRLPITKWSAEVEDNLFESYGLGRIPDLITHIATVEETIHSINSFVDTIDRTENVILPPSPQTVPKFGDAHEFISPKINQKLKTILFVLQKDFDINLNNPNALEALKGTNRPSMVRKESYVQLEVKALNKTVLVCDESENATFIFNTNNLESAGLRQVDLRNYTKQQLSDALFMYPGIGNKVFYSDRYIANIKESLSDNKQMDVSEQYLIPNAKDHDALTINQIARRFGIHTNTVNQIIEKHCIDADTYSFQDGIKIGVKTKDLDPIREDDMVAMPKSSEYGAVSLEYLTRNYGRGKEYIEELCKNNNIQIGSFRFGSRSHPGRGIIGSDQEKLLSLLDMNFELASEHNVVGVNEAIKRLGISFVLFKDIANELGIEPTEYKFEKYVSKGYSASDLNTIRQHPRICTPDAETYNALSVKQLALRYGVGSAIIKKVLKNSGIQTGDYYFRTRTSVGVLSEDLAYLDGAPEFTTPPAPDDVISTNDLRKKFVSSYGTIIEAAKRKDIPLRTYKFSRGQTTIGFTKEEAAIILQDENIAVPDAQSYAAISLNKVVDELGITRGKLKNVIDELHVRIGVYAFGPNRNEGMLQEDLEMIKKHLYQ